MVEVTKDPPVVAKLVNTSVLVTNPVRVDKDV